MLVSGPDGAQVLTKGAPESILASCTAIDASDGTLPFSDSQRKLAMDTFDGLSRAGYHGWASVGSRSPPIVRPSPRTTSLTRLCVGSLRLRTHPIHLLLMSLQPYARAEWLSRF